jgi:hypothetical protein
MTTPNDGGTAFPLMDAYGSTDKGMTLRDYFTAKAMLAAREKGGQ